MLQCSTTVGVSILASRLDMPPVVCPLHGRQFSLQSFRRENSPHLRVPSLPPSESLPPSLPTNLPSWVSASLPPPPSPSRPSFLPSLLPSLPPFLPLPPYSLPFSLPACLPVCLPASLLFPLRGGACAAKWADQDGRGAWRGWERVAGEDECGHSSKPEGPELSSLMGLGSGAAAACTFGAGHCRLTL